MPDPNRAFSQYATTRVPGTYRYDYQNTATDAIRNALTQQAYSEVFNDDAPGPGPSYSDGSNWYIPDAAAGGDYKTD